jgi:repressor LexA
MIIIAIMTNNVIIIIYSDKGDKKMIGDKVKELRKLLGMTQKDLADSLGLKSQTTIAAIENNKNRPSNELLSKMADFFKVSTDFLLEKVNQDPSYLRLLFSEKLKEKLKQERLTIENLSKKLDLPVQDLMIMKNANIGIDSFARYQTVAEYIGFPLEDIHLMMTKTPNSLKHDMQLVDEETPVYPSGMYTTPKMDLVSIPIVGVVRAGIPIFANENIEGHIPLPCSMVNWNKDYFALKIKGDSMNLEFQEGNIIVVEKTNVVDNGEIAVVLVDGSEATVKKVVQQNHMITLIPMSTNSKHTPTMYNVEKDDVHIIGKVKYAIKGY